MLTFFPFVCETNRNLIRFMDKNEIVGEIAFPSIWRETGIGFSECNPEKKTWISVSCQIMDMLLNWTIRK